MLYEIKILKDAGYRVLVLILVLMEYALRVLIKTIKVMINVSLNPCSNGICSTSK